MPIEEILDQLDELIDRSWSLPLTGGRCVVDADKVRELLDDVRLNLPTEIRQAQSIVADRTAIVEEAKKEAKENKEDKTSSRGCEYVGYRSHLFGAL